MTQIQIAQNLIGGEFVGTTSQSVIERPYPADRRQVIAISPNSTGDDATEAIGAAVASWESWAHISASERMLIVERALDLLEADGENLAILTVLESGKTLAECRGEVLRSITTVRFQVAAAANAIDHEVFNEDGVSGRLQHPPVGVVVVISPWNFPFSALLRKIVPALVMGNAVVAKPSELSPVSAFRIGQAFMEAGLPAGVLNIVHGYGATVGGTLVDDERVGAISFTGSTRVGLSIAEATGRRDLKVQLEMGGKNPLVILDDADIDQAVADAVVGAFTAAGQWCVATSRIIVADRHFDQVSAMMAARARSLNVGDGLHQGVEMGPLVSEAHLAKVTQALELASKSARVLAGGSPLTGDRYAFGNFVEPTVITDVADTRLIDEEIFGPVVSIHSATSVEDAIELADSTEYGLSASVYTSSNESAQQFLNSVTFGKVSINRPPNFGDTRIASGGRRNSGRGAGEGAESGLEFYSHERAVFIASL